MAPTLPFFDPDHDWQPTPILEFVPTPGTFTDAAWLTADFYNPHEVVLQIKLQFFADATRAGEVIFGLYPQVRARLRIPGTSLALNAWLLPREGALLKPMCGGELVRPEEVQRIRATLLAGPDGATNWWQTPWQIVAREPGKLENAESLHPFLLDEIGQNATRTWPDKTASAEAMVSFLRTEAEAADVEFPENWTRWGGAKDIRFTATGFFRTEHDVSRWWLVDPAGGAFWSAGSC